MADGEDGDGYPLRVGDRAAMVPCGTDGQPVKSGRRERGTVVSRWVGDRGAMVHVSTSYGRLWPVMAATGWWDAERTMRAVPTGSQDAATAAGEEAGQ